MLIIGETYNKRKADILDNIKVCRGLIKECNKVALKKDGNRELAIEVINTEHNTIKNFINELVELERWRVANKLERHTPYGEQ